MKGLVIAENCQQYKDWIIENKLNPKDYKYCRTAADIAGFHNIPLFYVGNFTKNPLFGSKEIIAYGVH